MPPDPTRRTALADGRRRIRRVRAVISAAARLARPVLANRAHDRIGGNFALVVRRAALRAAVAAPINEVSDSLARFSRRRLHAAPLRHAGGDEVASLTAAFNDAAQASRRRWTTGGMPRSACGSSPPTPAHELRTPLTVIGGLHRRAAPRGDRRTDNRAPDSRDHGDRERAHARTDRPADALGAAGFGGAARRSNRSTSPSCCAVRCDAARRLDDRRAIDYSVEGVEDDRSRPWRAGRSGLERDRKRTKVRAGRADPSACHAQQRAHGHHRAR